MFYNRKELKKEARAAVADAHPRAWVVTLVYLIIVAAVSGIIMSFAAPGIARMFEVIAGIAAAGYMVADHILVDLILAFGGSVLLFILLSLISALFSVVMSYGLVAYFVRVFRRESAGFGDLFSGFARAGTVLGSAILVGVFTFLWTMLFAIVPIVIMVVLILMRADIFLVMFLYWVLIGAASIGGVIIGLRYVLTPYVVMSEDTGALAAVRRSKELMHGNKWRYFVLGLSFIGWILLVGLITGVISAIGAAFRSDVMQILFTLLGIVAALPLTVWLETYIGAAYAGFYCTLSGKSAPPRLDNAVPGGDEPWNL